MTERDCLLHQNQLMIERKYTSAKEVPEHARESFRFDEFAGRVECVRLGALPPAKQVDFLLEAVLHMVGFLDRVNQVAPALNEVAVVNATAANATAEVFA